MEQRPWVLTLGVLCVLCGVAVSKVAGAQLLFDRPEYVLTLDDALDVQVMLDMDEGAPGLQAPSNGLFSVGVAVTYAGGGLSVVSTNDLVLPDELDSNGMGGDAIKEVGPGYAGGAGAVAFESTNAYAQALVLSVHISDLSPGTHQLGLELFFQSTDANFVDFLGNVLDGVITNFVYSTVRVVTTRPEVVGIHYPAAGTLGMLCENPSFVATRISVDGSPSVSPPVWTPETNVNVITNTAYEFDVRVPLGAAPGRFYRITADR